MPLCKGKTMARSRLAKRQAAWGILFVLPAFGGLLLFKVIPIMFATLVSFADYSTTRGFNGFVGFGNYKFLMADPVFYKSVMITVFFALILTLIQISIALFIAVLVKEPSKLNNAFRVIFFLPVVISMSITCIIWWIMYADWGLINSILSSAGIPRQQFLASPTWALWAIIIMLTWKGIGYWMIIYVAGLNNIPQSLYEASAIDGATRFQQFIHVTLPLLKRVIAFVVVADTTINFLIFAPSYIMTNGGPQGSTTLLAFYAYKNAFVYNDLGYASTISVVLLVLVAVIVAIQFRLLRASHEY